MRKDYKAAVVYTMLHDDSITTAINVALVNEPDWVAGEAACIGEWDIFTEATERTKVAMSARADAKAICQACPMLAACKAHVKRVKPREGVWAGLWYGGDRLDL